MNIFRNTFKAIRMATVLVISILVLGCSKGKTKVKINQDTGAVESINSDQTPGWTTYHPLPQGTRPCPAGGSGAAGAYCQRHRPRLPLV